MFDDCYLRLGQNPFAGCVPLTVQLLNSLYALPNHEEPSLREALVRAGADRPWSTSFAVAPDQTAAAVGAMLRHVMLATSDLQPSSIEANHLLEGSRARNHLEALRDLWASQPDTMPADVRMVKDFLTCDASDALQPMAVIWDREDPRLTPLERAVLEQLECHHGRVDEHDSDFRRLIAERNAPAALATTLAGHVQRHMLVSPAAQLASDDSLSILSVRDSLTECEATAAIIQHWLTADSRLRSSDIGIIIPASGEYAHYLTEAFNRAGLVASSLPSATQRRNVGAEAVLHFVQCRRRPAPTMALASIYSAPVLCWPAKTGAALAAKVMDGDFNPILAAKLEGRAAALFSLLRSPAPATTAQLKEQLRRFQQYLSDDAALRDDVQVAKAQITRLTAALGNALDQVEPDWDKAIQLAADFSEIQAERGSYFLGGISVMLAREAPARAFRKLVVLGFNDGAYPASPSGNPFFLDSEVLLSGLDLPSQARQLAGALGLFSRQLRAASEQVVLLLSERDRTGKTLSPSASLPLVTRLVEGFEDPEKFVISMTRGAGTIWDRLIAWLPRPAFKAAERPAPPAHFDLGLDLLSLRKKDDGSLRPQSPSRLETLLVSPLAWLLAELDAKHISWQPEQLNVKLRGSLAHEVFELLFVPGTDHPSDGVIDVRVPELLMERIRSTAPFLQGSTWVVERAALEAEIIKAAKHWSMVLMSLGAEIVGNEFWLSGSLFGHPVHGKADCLLCLPGGQPLVVDYKKSGSGMRRKRLKAGWDLQVDLYRKMGVRMAAEDDQTGARIAEALTTWSDLPGVAYHTLNDGGLLVNGAEGLDSAHIEAISGDIAENALQQIKARFEALKAGHLETNSILDENFFKKEAALGTYALTSSPLVAAFMRQDDGTTAIATGGDDD